MTKEQEKKLIKLLAERQNGATLEFQFRQLVTQWKSERPHSSSVVRIAMHPAYQQIIGMGRKATPFILAEMERELDHWFWALQAIEGVNPVPAADRGKLNKMADAWFAWAKQQGYQW